MSATLEEFQQRLGHTFADPELLRQALTHASLRPREAPEAADNQRLEFLGDAVLQLAVTAEIYRRFPPSHRGPAHRPARAARQPAPPPGPRARSRARRPSHLGRARRTARAGSAVPSSPTRPKRSSAPSFSEVGWEGARAIILRLLEPALAALDASGDATAVNPKGALQEKLQADGDHPPIYRCVSETGPAHARVYEVVVEWQGRELGRGHGASKKEAETRAAQVALEALPS